jgi:aminopeptidase-like protein
VSDPNILTPDPPDFPTRLRGALAFAISEMEDMLPYVPEYFREKWKYDDSIDSLRNLLKDDKEEA